MSSKAGGCDDDCGVLWDPAVCVLEQSVSFRLFGRLEDGRRAAPKELRSVRPLRVGQPIQSLDELIVELHEHFLPCHDHMVDHMVTGCAGCLRIDVVTSGHHPFASNRFIRLRFGV